MSIINELENYFDQLWPLNRSLTGDGLRKSLAILKELVPELEILEIPCGTQAYDWIVPPEWNVREAWIKDPNGTKIVDFAANNLHLVGYSIPFQGTVPLKSLLPHLYSLPKHPDWIPYVTSYYQRQWGFCLPETQKNNLQEGEYEVYIDSNLNENGSMTLGHIILPGETDEEILISTYVCHPSMANNELSGPLVAAFLYQKLRMLPRRRYTYRFVFLPETIGAITYLSLYGELLKEKVVSGLVVTCVGDGGPFNYKRSKRGNTLIDRAVESYLEARFSDARIRNFWPLGSDERQYCSPGFNLPIGSLIRSVYGEYPEYHTSADNKDFISFPAMSETIDVYFEIIQLIERNRCYSRTEPHCEPQLSKRGLYPTIGGPKVVEDRVKAIMWLLCYADGEHDLIDILKFSRCAPTELLSALSVLLDSGVLLPTT